MADNEAYSNTEKVKKDQAKAAAKASKGKSADDAKANEANTDKK